MTKQRNPDVDWGFHGSIPRVVRTQYKEVTPLQKWLYVCLKDLCGDNGTCFRTVKVLALETGLSTGTISESIPVLHTAGLIHAEKKSRTSGGKAVWHITITDIWALNGKIHPTKRSPGEQTPANVHCVNEERSHSEPERSPGETEAISRSTITSEAIKGGREEQQAPTFPPAVSHSPQNLREDEIWSLIETEFGTSYQPDQRASKQNSQGLASILKAGYTNSQLVLALRNMPTQKRRGFNLSFFYQDIPGYLATDSPIETMRKERDAGHMRRGSPTASAFHPPDANSLAEREPTPEEMELVRAANAALAERRLAVARQQKAS